MKRNFKFRNFIIYILSTAILLFLTIESIAKTDNSKLNKNKNPINIEEILKKNTLINVTEEMTIEEIDLEYSTKYKNNNSLPSGTIQISQEGKDGRQRVVEIKKYENGELISEKIVADNVTRAAITKVVEVGTGSGRRVYVPKVGDTCYVTSTTLSVKLEPDVSSDTVCTLNKNAEVRVLKELDDFYYISSKQRNGYIAKNTITKKVEEASENKEEEYSKSELIRNLNIDMDLNDKSNLSLAQFKDVLSNNPNDKNRVFEENAEYFYYAEQQYNINGIFLASVAIHESGWGTSKISKNKMNLFGYGAYDSNPYGGAYSFESYNEGIDLLARVFVKYYLNPAGTQIYDGNIASGKFYSGNNVKSVNKKYATDKNWANSVYKWMQYLYNRL